jgi:mRNA interferase RelE/StbE
MYQVEFTQSALKAIKKLDPSVAQLLIRWIYKHLHGCNDPYAIGKPLKGNLKGSWRYWLGDYRIIAHVQEQKLIILVFQVSHRRDAYDVF